MLPHPVTALRERLRSIAHAVGETREHVADSRAALAAQIEGLRAEVERNRGTDDAGRAQVDARLASLEADVTVRHGESARLREMLRAICDREPLQRERLRELRASDAYLSPFTESEPLVSVVIPTFDNHRLLRERAIPSVLAQTYQHFEVVVVGDAAPDEARAAVGSFADPRLRYSNLPYRGPYPPDVLGSWHVAGVPPYNEAVRLARGLWIAPLDDDDAFRPEHIQRLLETAQRERLEFVYGTMLRRHPNGSTEVLGRFPPEYAQFGLQAAMYHAGLADVFELELTDSLFDLPYDWGLVQRMLRAGVSMRMVDEISVDYYPSQWWTPRGGASPPPAPEWEFVPEGWALARHEDQACSRGWDVEEVARAYAERWPAFQAAISGAKPLGVAHELTVGGEMSNTSLVAHNAALTLAYALVRAAPAAGALSVLDWGGALGHQYAIARSALPEIEFDWHIRELPAVCREGRRASPSITFHEDERCLERSYDLVLASSSLQYAEDWRTHLQRLAGAARDSLLITRLPLVDSQPSFVVIQRAQAYGYSTEYLGWVFNRAELLDGAAAAGLELVREFFLQEPMEIAGAPESPSHGAFLFKRSS
jgi:putative methyltransferase (TIGR04325 family)